MSKNSLQWALTVPTYNRRAALRKSLELAVRQSRPPSQIVVVDASADFNDSRAQILDEVAPLDPTISFRYVPARVRSITTQRNQAMDLARADVLFMIDDDSFMYPDCAERVMEIYEADVHRKVAGVGPREVPQIPRLENYEELPTEVTPIPEQRDRRSLVARTRDKVKSLFDVERVLLPYDPEYPKHELPAELAHFHIGETQYLAGMRMTWRARWAKQERFDETLRRYSAAEDMDFSYRMSRHGLLLNALDARLHHAQDPSARLTRHTRALLGLLNIAYLYRRNGYDPARMFQIYRGKLLERLAVDAVRDVLRMRTSLPYVRADARALGLLPKILKVDDDKLSDWYGRLQSQIVEANMA